MRSILVTVSDDRMGRKGGQYELTQDRVCALFAGGHTPPPMRFDRVTPVRFENILQSSFYKNHKAMFDAVDPGKNGRIYKPFAIHEALKLIDYGDLLVYTDCSPEMWSGMGHHWLADCSLENLYSTCQQNDGILTHFVRWDTRPIYSSSDLGIHTHRNFTTSLCLHQMRLEEYEDSFQHASGMFVCIKSDITVQFVEEWLHYNSDPLCASLGDPEDPSDYSYWVGDENFKMGHRHDQSISGLLMNKYNRWLVDLRSHVLPHSPYNFINLCKTGMMISFIDSNSLHPTNRICKGDRVVNTKGQELTVFEVWGVNGEEVLTVGFHRQSAFKMGLLEVKQHKPRRQ